jgi:hypothetical protein
VNVAVCLWITGLGSAFAQDNQSAQPANEHPLIPVIKMAAEGLERMDASISDYSCTLVKRERLQGELSDHQYIFTKVRHEPFSVYMYFLGPDNLKGREVLYIEGQNDNKLRAHEGTGWKKNFGMVSLEPTSSLAMNGQRYPITMVGMRTLIVRLVEVGEHDLQYDEVDVKTFKGAKINGRVCTCIQAVHPVPRKHFRFHLARIFIDDELQVPIRYAAYLWPAKEGGKPVLDEEYTYLNLKLNNGFTDADFDYRNENYKFVKRNRR